MENRQGFLIGQFEGKVGPKSRVGFPQKFRKILGDSLIITKGYENSLIIVSGKNWEKTLLEGTEGKPFIHSDTRETRRFILGGASDIQLDSKGRFVLPSYLRDFGKIEDEIVFIGLYNYIEVWDKKRWEQHQGGLEKNIDLITKRLTDKEGEK